jgi:hypothetical protein
MATNVPTLPELVRADLLNNLRPDAKITNASRSNAEKHFRKRVAECSKIFPASRE